MTFQAPFEPSHDRLELRLTAATLLAVFWT